MPVGLGKKQPRERRDRLFPNARPAIPLRKTTTAGCARQPPPCPLACIGCGFIAVSTSALQLSVYRCLEGDTRTHTLTLQLFAVGTGSPVLRSFRVGLRYRGKGGKKGWRSMDLTMTIRFFGAKGKTMQTREQQLQRLRPDENSTWTVHALSLSRVIACRSHFLGRCCPPPTVPFIPFGLSLSTSRRPVLFHHRPALRSSDISSEKLNLRLTANFLRLFRPSQIDAAPPPTFFGPRTKG